MSYNDKKPHKDTSTIYKSLVPTALSANPEEPDFDIPFKSYPIININKLSVHRGKNTIQMGID